MRHIIFYKAGQGVCPYCGGLLKTLKSDTIILNCIDCNLLLRVCDMGQADAELEFEEVLLGNE